MAEIQIRAGVSPNLEYNHVSDLNPYATASDTPKELKIKIAPATAVEELSGIVAELVANGKFPIQLYFSFRDGSDRFYRNGKWYPLGSIVTLRDAQKEFAVELYSDER